MPPRKRKQNGQDTQPNKKMLAKKYTAPSFPALAEVEPALPADGDSPARGPVYRPHYAKSGPLPMAHKTLVGMFE